MVAAKLMTVAEFAAIGEPGRFDLIEGEVVAMSPASFRHGGTAGTTLGLLAAFIVPRKLGRLTTAEGGFHLGGRPPTVLCPDVAFVRAEREPDSSHRGFFIGPPDLAVEVISPSESGPMVARKVRLYLDAGCPLVWCVYPQQRTIVVHAPGVSPRTLHAGDILDGGDVLPGLLIAVADIFA
ncbi:MAG: Uma2 family endonuclease [Thermomicrobiales bacterium]